MNRENVTGRPPVGVRYVLYFLLLLVATAVARMSGESLGLSPSLSALLVGAAAGLAILLAERLGWKRRRKTRDPLEPERPVRSD